MGKKGGYTIKLSKRDKPFMAKSARHNRAQMQFKKLIGDPVGKCLQTKELGKSYSLTEKVGHIKECMLAHGVMKGMKLPVIDPNSYYNRRNEGRVGGGQAVHTA